MAFFFPHLRTCNPATPAGQGTLGVMHCSPGARHVLSPAPAAGIKRTALIYHG
jgi:hypothetical protein